MTRAIFVFLAVFVAGTAKAEVYRFPVSLEDRDLKRPKPGLEAKPKTLRLLGNAMGNYFGATAFEFEHDGRAYRRTKSYMIDHYMDAMTTKINELGCTAALSHQQAGQLFLDTMNGGTSQQRITIQALKEMQARGTLNLGELHQQMNSSESSNPDQYFYLESLSWLTAQEAMEIFDGEIPWERIAEVEDNYGLSFEQIKKRVEAGNPSTRLRVRRATLRVAIETYVIPGTEINGAFKLPFVKDLWKKGKQHLTPEGSSMFAYEFGRASQIPGLAAEAQLLVALASFATASHVFMFSDLPSSTWESNARVYFHSLRPGNTKLYEEGLGAKIIDGLNDPHDTVLWSSLDNLIEKAEPYLGWKFDDFRIARRMHDSMYIPFKWTCERADYTPHGPLVVKTARKALEEELRGQAKKYADPQWAESLIPTIMKSFDQPLIYPARTYNDQTINQLPGDWEERADYAMSGFDRNIPMLNEAYFKKFLFSLPRALRWDARIKNPRFMFATQSREIARQAQQLGLQVWNYTGSDYMVRYFTVMTLEDIHRLIATDPALAAKMKAESIMNWNHPTNRYFDMVNYRGLF